MDARLNRRQFLTTSATAAAGLSLPWPAGSAEAQGNAAIPATTPPTFKTKLQKAVILGGQPTEERLREIKAAGFDGIEYSGVLPQEQALETRKLVEKTGLRVHSVLRGWAAFNSSVPADVQSSFVRCEDALRTAQWLGADAVLMVTCRIPVQQGRGGGGLGAAPPFRMPEPWEFQIDFDERTGHIKSVVYGDNAPFAEYIKLHNHATDTSKEWTRKLIPLAEKTKVLVTIENVWNNLWVEPKFFAHFVQSFNNPWIKAYYDIGNNIKWAPPEEWVLALGSLLAKVHVKDFKLDPASPTGNGDWAAIRDGSTRWPVLRAALDRVGYNGWLTIEAAGKMTLEEQAKRLDMIMAGV
jgi:hexulose-6-phosphate isomerase